MAQLKCTFCGSQGVEKNSEMWRNGDDFHSRYMLKVWFEHAILYIQN